MQLFPFCTQRACDFAKDAARSRHVNVIDVNNCINATRTEMHRRSTNSYCVVVDDVCDCAKQSGHVCGPGMLLFIVLDRRLPGCCLVWRSWSFCYYDVVFTCQEVIYSVSVHASDSANLQT